MLYCLQLALIMLSIIYISFLVHRKTVSDLVHLKASREYPCEFQDSVPYTMPACHTHCPARALVASWNSRGVLHTMHAWLITYMVEMGHENSVRDGGDLFFETL